MNAPTHAVTGATDGIGQQTALELARKGAHVLVHGRTEQKAAAACASIKRDAPEARVSPVWGDLSKLTEVRALAGQIAQLAPKLDVLVNNAGVFMRTREVSVDGHELTLQINHLAPFLLTTALRPQLEAAAQGRVVNVSSMAHARGRVVLDDLESARAFEGYAAYGLSKLLNIHFTHELARRWSGTRVTTSALHPGVITTKLLKTGFDMSGASLESGARTSVFCATEPGLAKVSGRYYSDAREAKAAPHATNAELEATLWELSEQMIAARG
jgi:NAD(P)-dependent dehydrogenase (short-subunit alcohol dehydrogenase family)